MDTQLLPEVEVLKIIDMWEFQKLCDYNREVGSVSA